MSAISVAVVDDEESVRKALARLLRAAGFRTRTFATCPAFLASAAVRRPDCLILDLHMPGMPGLEMLRRMHSLGEQVPTIVITAFDEAEALSRCLSAGAAACLRKPLDGAVLLEAIAEALRHPF